MDGSYVPRRAGWDTHGLPVEVEVEKKLGITGKEQIEHQVGIAEFTRLCRESVYSYVDEFARLTTRIGYWVDMDDGVLDVEPGLHRVGLVAPPAALRPGAALRGPQGRALLPALRHGAVVARARAGRRLPGRGGRVGLRAPAHRRPGPEAAVGAEWLAVWTTTPWTLLSNTGVAVNPDLIYAVVDGTLVADELVDAVFGEGAVGSGHGAGARRRAGRPALRAPLRRPFTPARCRRVAGGPGRLRHDRGGHRPGAPGPGLRRGGPPDRPRQRPAVAEPGRARRALHRRRAPGWRTGTCARPTTTSTTGSSPTGSSSDGGPTCTRTRTAGAAARRSSTGASRAGTSRRRPARTTCWRRTRRWTGTRLISRTGASASGWPTTSTGPCRGTATGARRCRSGAAGAATCAAWAPCPSCPTCAGATSRGSTPTAPPSTR